MIPTSMGCFVALYTVYIVAAERLIGAYLCQSEIVTGRKVFGGKGVENGKIYSLFQLELIAQQAAEYSNDDQF